MGCVAVCDSVLGAWLSNICSNPAGISQRLSDFGIVVVYLAGYVRASVVLMVFVGVPTKCLVPCALPYTGVFES
jgi:hypothetical protein